MSSTRRCVRAPGAHAIRGAALPSRLIAIVVIVLVLGAGAWWFFMRPGAPPIPGVTTTPTPVATPTSPDAAAPAVSDELTVDQLYREARKAMNDNRMAAPAGNNALEYYLKIVAKQPDDSGAKDALRELFPFATGTAEDQINQGNFDEANRVIALLAQADPSNYSLTILRSKLDAKKKQVDRDQQQAQAAAAAAAARQQAPGAAGAAPATATATTAPAAATDATATPATAPAATAPAPAAADTTAASATPPPAAAPRPTPAAPPPPAPAGESRDVAITSPPVPVYPIEAARSRKEGWVEVEFTVGPDGAVSNAHVTGSQPARLFDREAVAAVQRAKFEPKLVNGTPVAATLRRRIEFKLGNN